MSRVERAEGDCVTIMKASAGEHRCDRHRSALRSRLHGQGWISTPIEFQKHWASKRSASRNRGHICCSADADLSPPRRRARRRGMEIRDCIMWIYGNGFPGNRITSARIDRHGRGAGGHRHISRRLEHRAPQGWQMGIRSMDRAMWGPTASDNREAASEARSNGTAGDGSSRLRAVVLARKPIIAPSRRMCCNMGPGRSTSTDAAS
jgi:hypothetical protein